MTVRDLTPAQLSILKEKIVEDRNTESEIGTSWGELAQADSLISNEEVYNYFEGYRFVPEDFFIGEEIAYESK